MGTLRKGPGRKLNLVFDNPNICYITVPKAANSSIKHRLCKLYHDVDLSPRDTHANQYGAHADIEWMEENKNRYFIFSVVRNPWDRAVSLYNNKIRVEGGGTKNICKRHPQFKVGMSFESYCKGLLDCPVDFLGDFRHTCELHLRSQHTWTHRKDKSLAHFIGRVENINNDWKHICETAGLEYSPLAQKNTSTYIKDTWKEYYTQETMEIIAEVYKKDIEVFGYEF